MRAIAWGSSSSDATEPPSDYITLLIELPDGSLVGVRFDGALASERQAKLEKPFLDPRSRHRPSSWVDVSA